MGHIFFLRRRVPDGAGSLVVRLTATLSQLSRRKFWSPDPHFALALTIAAVIVALPTMSRAKFNVKFSWSPRHSYRPYVKKKIELMGYIGIVIKGGGGGVAISVALFISRWRELNWT